MRKYYIQTARFLLLCSLFLSPSSLCNSLIFTVFTRMKNMIHLTFPSKCPSFRKGIHVFLPSLKTRRNRNKIRYNLTKRQFVFKCWVKTVVFKTISPLVIHIQCIETKWNFPENSWVRSEPRAMSQTTLHALLQPAATRRLDGGLSLRFTKFAKKCTNHTSYNGCFSSE